MDVEVIGLYVGVLGIVIGVMVSYFFYKKSLRVKEPSWMITSNNLIRGFGTAIKDLRIIYNDHPIENLTVSKIIFWNNGSETIDGSDLKTVDPLRIKTNDGVSILDVKILASNNPASRFQVHLEPETNCAYITFDYLDEKQGAVIQVIHTGKSSADIEMAGAIKGVKQLQYKFPMPTWAKFLSHIMKKMRIPKKFAPLYGAVGGVVYIILGAVYYFSPPDSILSTPLIQQGIWSKYVVKLFAVFISLSGLLLVLISVQLWRRYWSSPKGLEVFHSDFDDNRL